MTLIENVAGDDCGTNQTPLSGQALWDRVREEAEESRSREPLLGTLLLCTVLNRSSLTDAIIARVSSRISDNVIGADQIEYIFTQAIAADPTIAASFIADLAAVLERDPACTRLLEPLLYFKGFHALQAYRLSHWLWNEGRRDLALQLQSRISSALQCDIHPAASIGKGIFLDHATGLVVGATTVIEDDVSILQNVTLGGTGNEAGDRHPKVRRGVLLGAGAEILGNIEIGTCARVAAGSVVLKPVPPHVTVAGVPARIVGHAGCAEPSRDMTQAFDTQAFDMPIFVHVFDGAGSEAFSSTI
jgi:serine O-acetyltransferase